MMPCRSKNAEVYEFGKTILDSMPPHSLLTTLGDLQHNAVKSDFFCAFGSFCHN
jgi:hypothetical protein